MQRRTGFAKNQSGYSLAEVLVIIGIAATMVAIAAPPIISQITHLRLSRSVRDVVTELNAARFKAIAKNSRYRVNFTVNPGATPPDTYSLSYWNGASWQAEAGRASGALGAGISITSPGANFTTEFYPNGTATATSICINNTEKANDRMKVTVTGSTGMIQVTTGC